ncbi:MAG TPA: OsmC family protein [Isosphaeraceae bacterium]|jgi:uncharacterized OsmC-like protein|nr:OsmC family protein [Isosphaeraceae bacterium]
MLTADELRARQGPLKQRYRDDPAAALATMTARGTLDPATLSCRVEAAGGPVVAGLHESAGGDGTAACSGEMLLQALVACAGVTLTAVAGALALPLRGGTVVAEGDLDFRGTLGVSKEVPVGFHAIRLAFDLDLAPGAILDDDRRATLLKLTERYCVIAQSVRPAPTLSATVRAGD